MTRYTTDNIPVTQLWQAENVARIFRLHSAWTYNRPTPLLVQKTLATLVQRWPQIFCDPPRLLAIDIFYEIHRRWVIPKPPRKRRSRQYDDDEAIVRVYENYPDTPEHRVLKRFGQGEYAAAQARIEAKRNPPLTYDSKQSHALQVALHVWTTEIKYLQIETWHAVRYDLDGKPCGEVKEHEAIYAATKLQQLQEQYAKAHRAKLHIVK